MEQKTENKPKLLLRDIPHWENLLIFDTIMANIQTNGLWFEVKDDSPAESQDIYTTDGEEYQWHVDFADAYEWIENHQLDIQQAMRKELQPYHGDISASFDELSDYIDRLPEIKRRVKKWFSTQ